MSNVSGKAKNGANKASNTLLHPFSLKKSYGKRYRIRMEETWAHEKPENKVGYEGWYEQIPTACGGFIALFQDNPTVILQFYTPKQRLTCRKLAEQFKHTPGVLLDDRFDGYETTLFFPIELFEQVAQAVGARKRRVLSPEHKAKLAEAGKATRFNPVLPGSEERQNLKKEGIGIQADRSGDNPGNQRRTITCLIKTQNGDGDTIPHTRNDGGGLRKKTLPSRGSKSTSARAFLFYVWAWPVLIMAS